MLLKVERVGVDFGVYLKSIRLQADEGILGGLLAPFLLIFKLLYQPPLTVGVEETDEASYF